MKIILGQKIQVPLERIFLVAINMALIYLFVFRFMPSSLDDENYLYQFSTQEYLRNTEFLTSEYLYSLFTRIFATADGFFGVRVLILAGLILQLFCQLRFEGVRSWIYLLGYYLLPNLAILYSYTQLRYGLGLGMVCLAFCINHKKNLWGQLLLLAFASSFHAGFIILIPIYIVCRYFNIKKNIITKYFFIETLGFFIIGALSVYLYFSIQEDSRIDQYSEAGLNLYGLAQFVLPLVWLVSAQFIFEKKLSFETNFVVLLTAILLGLHFFEFVPSALPRLLNTALILSIISALKSNHTSRYGIKYCILLYITWIFVLSLDSERLTVFENWKYLL